MNSVFEPDKTLDPLICGRSDFDVTHQPLSIAFTDFVPTSLAYSSRMELKSLGTYTSVTEANLVRAKLETFGIDAVVQRDVASGSIPTFEALAGVKVLVREADLAEALEMLERMLPAGD